MMMSNLPEDLLEEILCRIPAASLERLRSTCKGWNRLFNDKRFAIKHLDKAPKQFLVLMASKSSMCLLSVSLNGDPAITEHSVTKPSFKISKVFHCDGLLLCTNNRNTIIVVWNPCTGQTRLIQHYSSNGGRKGVTYTLGSYQDNNSGNNSYKILRYKDNRYGEFEIYEFNSNTWRVVDVTPECLLIGSGVSLKGKTYWFAWDESQGNHVLVSFDYTRERFERMRLPYNSFYKTMSLSVVREEKLSVILQLPDTSGKEVWVRNQIDEWRKLVTVLDDPKLCTLVTFRKLINEEKKVFICYGICIYMSCKSFGSRKIVYIAAGEDIKVTHVDLEASTLGSCKLVFLDYVPSLVQIQ